MSASRQPPPPPRRNLRRHPRYELLASVELHHGSETLVLPARNLSLGGMYLGADGNDLKAIKHGSSVEVLLFNAVDESHPAVRAGASVVRVDQDGIALRWLENSDTSLALASLLEALKPSS